MAGNEQVPFPFTPDILTENSARISWAVNDFNVALARGFVVKEDMGRDLLRVIDHMINVSREVIDRSQILTKGPNLGTTPAALLYRPFLATTATDPVHGFIPAVQRLIAGLENLRANIKQSIATYRDVESDVSDGMHGPW